MFKRVFSPALLSFWLFITFSLGIILGFYLPFFLLFLPLFLVSGALVFIFYKRQKFLLSDIFIMVLFLSLGALWYLPQAYKNMDDFVAETNNVVLQVVSLPKENILRNSFLAETKSINGAKLQQRIRVFDYTKKMAYLNSYEVTGKISKIHLASNNFYALWVKSNVLPINLPQNIWGKCTKKISYHLISIFKNNLSDESYRFLSSVFLGRRELLEEEEKDAFRDAGISHLLAISGSNISLVAVVLFFVLKLFGVRFRPRLLVSFIFLFIYTVITGANPPVLRATIMYLVFSLGYFAKRKVNPYNSLGLSGLVCLLINPAWLFDVGFQLSFLSIFALVVGFRFFPVKPAKFAVMSYIKYLFFSSLYVTLLITPLISYYFSRIYILSIFNNLVLIPFFSLILVMNFLLIIFSPIRFVSQSIGAVLSLLIPLFYRLSSFLGAIKFSFVTWKFSSLSIIIYYFILVIIGGYWRHHVKTRLNAATYGGCRKTQQPHDYND